MGFFYKFILGLLMVFMLSISVAHAFVPPGFETVNSKPGWTIWKKSQNGGDVYVQKIDLNQRSIQFINNTKQNGSFPSFLIQDKFATMSVLSLSNGSFMNEINSANAYISYPYKNGSLIDDGHATKSEYSSRELRVFYTSSDGKNVSIVKYYHPGFIQQSHTGNYMTGVTPYHNQGGRMHEKIGRTFIAIQGNKTVYLLNAEKLTQDEARLNLMNFVINESDIVMLDGSISTQLSYKTSLNQTIDMQGCKIQIPGACKVIEWVSNRKVPQAIAVY